MAQPFSKALEDLQQLLVVLLLPGVVLSQTPAEIAFRTEQQYLALIDEHEQAGGVTAPELIEPLLALGEHYYTREDYESAAEVLARARQILRVNQGFDSVEELPVFARLVRAANAGANVVAAWELESSLLALAVRHAGQLETLPIFREAAQRRLELRRSYLNSSRPPPQIELGCYYGWQRYLAAMMLRGDLFNSELESRATCGSGSRDTVNAALLLEARTYQLYAVDVLLRNDLYTSDELWQALCDMLRTSDALQRRLPQLGDPILGQMMTRLLNVAAEDSATKIRRAHIQILLADLNVVRSRQADRYNGYDVVMEQYRQAYEALRAENLAEEELAEIFAPPVPVTLPSYDPNPLAAITEAEARGYIDVRFEVTTRGRARRTEVLASSDEVRRADRRELEQLLYRRSFRPRLLNGEAADSEAITVRYYVRSADTD